MYYLQRNPDTSNINIEVIWSKHLTPIDEMDRVTSIQIIYLIVHTFDGTFISIIIFLPGYPFPVVLERPNVVGVEEESWTSRHLPDNWNERK